ncbi:type I-Fv CRISPR-associated protein Cas5fv [Methylomonas koyamae]|uniref:Cas5fv helical domain-containing protein n=1 Tax=Methylomonas koyamae TaxID=702114 RepID=A0AA91D8T7_9GAMM|nr:type I-Fv CRISPR-associated protein Cas5fv [Methylomonas koyamae]OAI21874.1 hypothetical protein A1356_20280 [Methylomonas koyamae]
MFIKIRYESSWRNSFLEDGKYIGAVSTQKKLKEKGYKPKSITKDTVMGVLNRLIGEQRKLDKARNSSDYYFNDIENILKDEDINDKVNYICNEMVYLRNISGSDDPSGFMGMIKANDPIFTSEFSKSLWGIFYIDIESVCDFCLGAPYDHMENFDFDPTSLMEQFGRLNKLSAINIEGKVKEVFEKLQKIFPDVKYKVTTKNQIKPIAIYASAFYIQIDRLKESYDLRAILSDKGVISGIAKSGIITGKDFMGRYSTGGKKPSWGNPYLPAVFGLGNPLLTKAGGTLEITLNISHEQALDLQDKIDCAGVSSFYLGKKGLAYVEDIRI